MEKNGKNILYVRYMAKCIIVHYATSAMKRFLTSVSLQHEPKASDVITLVKETFFARVSYEILYHEVWKCGFPHAKRAVKPHLRTRSEIKYIFFQKLYIKNIIAHIFYIYPKYIWHICIWNIVDIYLHWKKNHGSYYKLPL